MVECLRQHNITPLSQSTRCTMSLLLFFFKPSFFLILSEKKIIRIRTFHVFFIIIGQAQLHVLEAAGLLSTTASTGLWRREASSKHPTCFFCFVLELKNKASRPATQCPVMSSSTMASSSYAQNNNNNCSIDEQEMIDMRGNMGSSMLNTEEKQRKSFKKTRIQGEDNRREIQIKERRRQPYPVLFFLCYVVMLVTGVVYLHYISTASIKLVLGKGAWKWINFICFLVAEYMSFISAIFFYFGFINYVQRKWRSLDDFPDPFPQEEWPKVDVCIAHFR